MKKSEQIVSLLLSDLEGKRILEVACGCAEFSISAARHASSVSCIDLDGRRLPDALPSNVFFEIMDAAAMNYSNDSFDTIVLYNAFSHILPQWDAIKKECLRILKSSGQMYIVSTWKLDITVMQERFAGRIEQQKGFRIVKLEK